MEAKQKQHMIEVAVIITLLVVLASVGGYFYKVIYGPEHDRAQEKGTGFFRGSDVNDAN